MTHHIQPTFRACFFLMFLFGTLQSFCQPTVSHENLSIRKVLDVGDYEIRIDHDPNTGEIYYASADGSVWMLDPENGQSSMVFRSSDHGLYEVYGLEIGKSGNLYLVAMSQSSGNNIATIKRYSESEWTTMATATYPISNLRDHRFNEIIETPDQQHVLVNSGSRTDHGEETSDGSRDVPLTTKILKLPVDAKNIVLQNDLDFLESNGYIFAYGVRNHFDMAYAPNGDLFGVENCGARDDEEELNWLQKGHHYGFPWRMGTYDNPMQFEDFNPPSSDPLIVDGINMERTFYNDPNYPEAPAGVTFTDPIPNYGPDADRFRDIADGAIKDASDLGLAIGSFTPHSSPLALAFDVDSILADEFRGKGFTMSYNGAFQRKYEPFGDPGEDLLMLDLKKENGTYTVNVHRIAEGFSGPVDATLVGNKLYVIENGDNSAIWEVTFPIGEDTPPPMSVINNRSQKIFPNPFQEVLNIDLTNHLNGSHFHATLQSLDGKVLKRLSSKDETPAAIHWKLDELPPGVYLLSIRVGEVNYQHRIIKGR